MLQKIILLLIFCFIPLNLLAKEPQKVAILPWQSYSIQDISLLREEMGGILSSRLVKFGNLVIIDNNYLKDFLPKDKQLKYNEELAREIGLKAAADLVMWGSLTKIGGKISLDIRILETGKNIPPSPFFTQAEGTEDLFANLDGIVKEIIAKISLGKKIVRIEIQGNRRIESAAIKMKMDSKEGDLYLPETVQEDIKNIYKMGYFTDIRVEQNDLPAGKELIFIVREKSSIKEVVISGNDKISTEKIEEVMDIKPHSLLDINVIKADVKKIEGLYRGKGFYEATVNYEIKDEKTEEIKIVFMIEENEKVFVKKISFIRSGPSVKKKRELFLFSGFSRFIRKIKNLMGAKHDYDALFDEVDLKNVMETKEKSPFPWFTSSGIYNKDMLDIDLQRISAFYYDHGFLEHTVGNPKIEMMKKRIYITIPIDEGYQFKVGNIDFTGDLILPKDALQRDLRTIPGKIFNRSFLGKDISELNDIYADQGYAFADVSPRTKMDHENQVVDVIFEIEKKEKVYIENINITGNTKTRDKIIRREFAIIEGDTFSSSKLRESNQRVKNLGYFEYANIKTQEGSADDRLNLNVEVKEQPTGAFSFGAGYSSVDSLVAMAQVSQSNLFGKGLQASVSAQLGGDTSRYILSITEPWLFDTPISGNINIFNWEKQYDEFDQASKGGRIGIGFPIIDNNTRLHVGYRYEVGKITAVAWDASYEIMEEYRAGETSSSAIKTTFTHDTRNDYLSPTHGNKSSLFLEFVGLGGDNRFVKVVATSAWYFPVGEENAILVRGKAGYAPTFSGRKLPVFERFFLGGLNSVRGFNDRDIGPKIKKIDINGDVVDYDVIGGNKELLFNAEYIFPLVKGAGMKGLLFFDAGSSFGKIRDVTVLTPEQYFLKYGVPGHEKYEYDLDMKLSIGVGIRWRSPMGPLRIEWGYNLNPDDDEDQSNFAFSMGTMF